MADLHDNRATVTLGGDEFTLVASKRAERIYGDRFRADVEALGESNSYYIEQVPTIDDAGNLVTDDAGNPVTHGVSKQIAYRGRLKYDIAVSSATQLGSTAEIPDQVIAATWAMARAAGSTDLSYDKWFAWWLTLPSNTQEDLDLFEAVCVDLSERAFFRDLSGPRGSGEPDEGEGGKQGNADG